MARKVSHKLNKIGANKVRITTTISEDNIVEKSLQELLDQKKHLQSAIDATVAKQQAELKKLTDQMARLDAIITEVKSLGVV